MTYKNRFLTVLRHLLHSQSVCVFEMGGSFFKFYVHTTVIATSMVSH